MENTHHIHILSSNRTHLSLYRPKQTQHRRSQQILPMEYRLRTDCVALLESPIIPSTPDRPADLLPNFTYQDVTDGELRKWAMEDDSYAQQEYGSRLQNHLVTELASFGLSQDYANGRWSCQFDSMKEALIAAVHNRSILAARVFGDTPMMPTLGCNQTEPITWLLIEQRMGGDLLDEIENDSQYISLRPTDETKEASELLATRYIRDFDLWFLDSALQTNLVVA